LAACGVLLRYAFTLRSALAGRRLRRANRLHMDASTRWRHLHRRARSMLLELQPGTMFGADGVHLEQRRLPHQRLLRQHHQRRLPGGGLFVARHCCVHGYRSSVHELP
jgi:hypothetical protein